jgi:outer membrane protein TolC
MRGILSLPLLAFICVPAAVGAAPNKAGAQPKPTPAQKEAGADKALTVHECINEALGRSPQLQSDRYLLKADSEAIKHARASLLPDFTGAAELQNVTGSPIGPFSVLGVNNPDVTGVVSVKGNTRNARTEHVSLATVGNGSLNMRYPLYENGSILGFNNAPAVAAAKGEYVRQQWTIRLSEQVVIETVAGCFYNAAAYLEKAELDRENVELAKKRLDIMKQELTLDLTLPQYVEIAKAQLDAAQQTLATSEQRAMDSAMQLAELIGRPLRGKLKLDLAEPRIPPVPPVGTLLDRVTMLHPSVGVQHANIDVAQQNLRLAEAQLRPTVNFVTNYTGATAFGSENPDLLYFLLRVEVPIFDWGAGRDRMREEEDKLEAAKAQLGQVSLNLREAILTLLSDIHTTESTLAGLEREYIQTKDNVALIQEQHEQGISTQLTLVDAQEALTKAKDGLLLAKLVQQLQYVQLQKLSGGVWAWNK